VTTPFAFAEVAFLDAMPTTDIYLDSNVWDLSFDRNIDLAAEFPPDEFRLWITREMEFEIPKMPERKRKFVRATIATCNIGTDALFGFYDDSKPPDEQRVRGFDQGRWASKQELDFIAQEHRSDVVRPTKLQKHEADISLAARSFHSVVLTLDTKRGPLKRASRQGGKVVFLNGFDTCGISLREFVLQAIS
jgi:hypothetical protein